MSGNSSVGRASAVQAECRGFAPRFPLHKGRSKWLKGSKIENIINTNITSEGLIKGVIQIPPDGNPIIMLSDHGTIGGYPKIGVIISADYDRLVQLTPGSKIKFKLVELSEAETLFKLYNMETQKILNQLKWNLFWKFPAQY